MLDCASAGAASWVDNVGGANTTAVLEMEAGNDPDDVDVEAIVVADIDAFTGRRTTGLAF